MPREESEPYVPAQQRDRRNVLKAAANEQHTFTLRDQSGAQQQITMTSAAVTYSPVPTWSVINQPDGPVGYLLFNDHVVPAEKGLFDAIERRIRV